MLLPILLSLLCSQEPELPPDVVVVNSDDTVIDRSCRVRFEGGPIPDENGNGVVHIVAEGISVDFEGGELRGVARGEGAPQPDEYTGIGVWVHARHVEVRNARISGYKVGLYAEQSNSLLLEDLDVSGNFRQRLGSTPEREDSADWLQPHDNDKNEWLERYGAGIWIEDERRNSVIRRCRARRGQNGLVLDGVDDTQVYDNDFSYLSGWGIAMWRSSRNTISRNALDYCVRGYSHGVYNRGQDSAGLLLFEQCSENVIIENSVTHGGDGFFGFAGKEALGERPAIQRGPPGAPSMPFSYERAGCNENKLIGNDFSYSVAHGVEITFSFGNVILANTMRGNGICGIWAGYSQDTQIRENLFAENGEFGYGRERGGVNIEHGRGNEIRGNRFHSNRCGVHLWWDADEHLSATPWAEANGVDSRDNHITGNVFEGDEVAVELRATQNTRLAANEYANVLVELRADEADVDGSVPPADSFSMAEYTPIGDSEPIGLPHTQLGREHILMTEWGPWDGSAPLLRRVADSDDSHTWRLYGGEFPTRARVEGEAELKTSRQRDWVEFLVVGEGPGAHPYQLIVETGNHAFDEHGILIDSTWDVRFFQWTKDPREDLAGWLAESEAGVSARVERLDLSFGSAGPSELSGIGTAVSMAGLEADRFGTLATTTLALPAGRWRLRTVSDDGLRVRVDGELLIDDWTWHAPRPDAAEFELGEAREVTIEVDHFELDGFAVLSLSLKPAYR